VQTAWRTPQSDTELMPQEQILDFKPVPGLEQVGDKRPQQSKNHAHRVGSCPDSI